MARNMRQAFAGAALVGETQHRRGRSVTDAPRPPGVALSSLAGSGCRLQEKPGPHGVTQGWDTAELRCDGTLLARPSATFVAVGWPGPFPGLIGGCLSVALESA